MCVGLVCLVPMLHLTALPGSLEDPEMAHVIAMLGAMIASNLSGALFYATRVPEALAPGSFDRRLSSHSIFHLFVCLAASIHYACVLKHMSWRARHPCD